MDAVYTYCWSAYTGAMYGMYENDTQWYMDTVYEYDVEIGGGQYRTATIYREKSTA